MVHYDQVVSNTHLQPLDDAPESEDIVEVSSGGAAVNVSGWIASAAVLAFSVVARRDTPPANVDLGADRNSEHRVGEEMDQHDLN